MSKTNTDTALQLLKTNKEKGLMKIDNPEELMEKLTKRYGDKAPDLVVAAITEPSKLMEGLGQEKTTSAKTLEYLVSDNISEANIQKLGGTPEQQASSTGFKLEALSQDETQQIFGQNAQTTLETSQPTSPNLSQLGQTDVYGNQISQSSSSSNSDTDSTSNNSDNNQNTSQYSDPWSELFSNLMSGDLGKMIGAALALEIANQAHLAFGSHYSPFPHHCHPYRDRIDHFNHCVDNRSKTEKTLDKVADVAHATGHILGATGHLIGAIKGNHRR